MTKMINNHNKIQIIIILHYKQKIKILQTKNKNIDNNN